MGAFFAKKYTSLEKSTLSPLMAVVTNMSYAFAMQCEGGERSAGALGQKSANQPLEEI